jgi:hypothetical protein
MEHKGELEIKGDNQFPIAHMYMCEACGPRPNIIGIALKMSMIADT